MFDQYATFGSTYSEKQISMLEVYQEKLIYEITCREENAQVEIVKTDANELAMIFSLIAVDINEAGKKFTDIICKIHTELSENMGFTLTAGVGSVCDDINKVYLSYKEARRSLAYKVIRGNNRVILNSEVPQISNWQYIYPYDIEKEIFNSLKQGEGKKSLSALGRYFEYAQANITERAEVRYAFIHLFDSTVSLDRQARHMDCAVYHLDGLGV